MAIIPLHSICQIWRISSAIEFLRTKQKTEKKKKENLVVF